MAVSHHKYTDGIVQHLYGILRAESQKGTPRDYEVRVDSAKVIPRTPALELFDSFAEFIRPETHTVTVVFYRGTSQHNDKYILYLRDNPFGGGEGLAGPDLEEQITSKLKDQRKDFELDGLKKKNRKLRQKIRKKNKYIDKLENKLMEHKAQRFHLGKINMGDLSSYALEGIIRRNTHWLAGVPGGKALAGAIEADNEQKAKALQGPADQPPPEGKASFQAATAPALTPEQQIDIATGSQIRNGFPVGRLEEVQKVLGLLASRPDLLDDTIEFLTKKITKKDE